MRCHSNLNVQENACQMKTIAAASFLIFSLLYGGVAAEEITDLHPNDACISNNPGKGASYKYRLKRITESNGRVLRVYNIFDLKSVFVTAHDGDYRRYNLVVNGRRVETISTLVAYFKQMNRGGACSSTHCTEVQVVFSGIAGLYQVNIDIEEHTKREAILYFGPVKNSTLKSNYQSCLLLNKSH